MRLAASVFLLALTACGGAESVDTSDTSSATAPTGTNPTNTGTTTGGTTGTTATYAGYDFESRFEPGVSSVAHSGQTVRQVLIKDMKTHLGGITERIDSGLFFPYPGDVSAELDFFFTFDGASAGQVPMLLSTEPAAEQQVYGDISTSANLVGKLAGNDPTGQHKDWSVELVGWDDPSVTTPESLVRHWFDRIDAAAVARMSGDIPLDPTGRPIPAVYLTPEGQDLQQLLEKFFHGAIALSQGADDYLDDDLAGKGLNADNTVADDADPYTALEHAWDEGFAYFGASHFYGDMSDADIIDIGLIDADNSGSIDLSSEYCFGVSVAAAKRDAGAIAATDFTDQAWTGFYSGRALLAASTGELTQAEMDELKGYRDQAVDAWEDAIAATVVHYINDTLQDMDRFDTASYDFASHAKHWSELKGYGLAMQFNPRSPLSDSDFATFHALVGQQPVLPGAAPSEIAAYRDDLNAAKLLLGTAYGFDAANLGDDDGLNGW